MKFADYDIVFQEIPGEVSLAINISHCPNRCPGCHSAYLMDDVGEVLNETSLSSLLSRYGKGITCVSFMGGDREPLEVARLAAWLHKEHPQLKTAWYSGKPTLPEQFPVQHFQYIKIGPYLEKQGPLNVRSTNQRLYSIQADGSMSDITSVFWKK